MTPATRCPAASAEHPVSSLNPCDMRCAITGLIQAAEGSPCASDGYMRCQVWVAEKRRIWAAKRANVSDKRLGPEGWA